MTMMSELGTYLAASTALVVNTDLFYGTMKTEPAECASFVEYQGRGYVKSNGGGGKTEIPRMQVLYRAETYDAGITGIRAIAAVLDVDNVTMGSTFYQRVEPLQPPFFLERDDNDRFVFACNFEITRESA